MRKINVATSRRGSWFSYVREYVGTEDGDSIVMGGSSFRSLRHYAKTLPTPFEMDAYGCTPLDSDYTDKPIDVFVKQTYAAIFGETGPPGFGPEASIHHPKFDSFLRQFNIMHKVDEQRFRKQPIPEHASKFFKEYSEDYKTFYDACISFPVIISAVNMNTTCPDPESIPAMVGLTMDHISVNQPQMKKAIDAYRVIYAKYVRDYIN